MKSAAEHRVGLRLSGAAILFALSLAVWLAEPAGAQSGEGTIPGPDQFLPIVRNNGAETVPEIPPPVEYDAVEVDNDGACRADGRPAMQHGDLNLALRGYEAVDAPLTLVDYNGATDPDAPQLPGLFVDKRLPALTAGYQVYDWDWGCGPDGCRSALLDDWPVTLLALAVTPGETLAIPARGPSIDEAGHKALVLYAEPTRLTLAYTRHDSAACGYIVHLEDLRVEPSLVSFYTALDAAGRTQLPGLTNDELLGVAAAAAVKVSVRDTGQFMDPRARKDWWQGF